MESKCTRNICNHVLESTKLSAGTWRLLLLAAVFLISALPAAAVTAYSDSAVFILDLADTASVPLNIWPLALVLPAMGLALLLRRRRPKAAVLLLALMALLVCHAAVASDPVSNVTVSLRSGAERGIVDVYYDLAHPTDGISTVTLSLSKDGGGAFPFPCTSVTGDVGPGVSSGTGKHIVWNAMADYPGEVILTAAVRVTVDLDPIEDVAVPDVVGGTQSSAESLITAAGLTVGTVSEEHSESVAAGDVISQNPASGTSVAPGSAVNLVVSIGLETETILLPDDVPLKMVRMPTGAFMMGRYPDEQDSFESEDPQHQVTIGYDYWMGKYPVTQAQWEAVMGTNPSGFVGANRPVEQVSWDDAKAFIAALNSLTGKTFRLPSEAEWEYAARAGTTTRFYWGNDPDHTQIGDYAWWSGNSSSQTHDVGGKLPNAFGLYDMSGNVWEWCEDDWHWAYIGAPADGSAWVDSPRDSHRVIRGGGWDGFGSSCRSAYRGNSNPSNTDNYIGFRLSRSEVSGEPEDVAVPDVVGETQSSAESSITSAGLTVGTVSEEYHETVTAGHVISQNPASGTSVAPGSAVDLVVSKGEASPGDTETILLSGDVPLEMVRISAGTFMMGRYPGEQGSHEREDPQHQVTIGYDYWMAKYPVTQAQWHAVMGTNPSHFAGANRPVEQVSWDDAKAYIAALNSLTGKNFRLPSEAEWEYAARAGTTTRFYWGDDPDYTQINDYAWWSGNSSSQTHDVGGKLPNAFGLCDMSGNVYEWCEDDYHSSYIGAPADGSAWVDSPRGSSRALRGGGWNYSGSSCRSAARVAGNPSGASSHLGFRLSR